MLENRTALVLYGTETGTSQDLAEELGRCLQRIHFQCDVQGFDDVRYETFKDYTFVVFALSTTGQGDFPGNARKLWTSLLKRRLGSTTLSGVEYAMLGLGDSSYSKFNWAARKLDKRLRQLGAEQLLDACEADEQGEESTDGAFLAWLPTFRSVVLERWPLAHGMEPIPDSVLLPSKWNLERGSEGAITESVNGRPDHNTFCITVKENRRVTPLDHWQDVRFLSLHAPTEIDYLPGDVLSIQPKNHPDDVQDLVDMMKWNDIVDKPLVFKINVKYQAGGGAKDHGPSQFAGMQRMTLRRLLLERLDINAIPRRSFFAAIANYTDNDMHKERLVEFTDPQYLDEYYDYATRPRRSILEIMQEFDSVKLPWQEIANVLPVLRPRQFSITSGGNLKKSCTGTTFELLVAIVKYRTVIKRTRQGVCTRYLANLPVGTTIDVTLSTEGRLGSAQELCTKKHLLIGTGTGIAPLRALIHEKACMQIPTPPTTLFFGARNRHADYFFQGEWTNMIKGRRAMANNHLDVVTAFSRDQGQKMYVQDRIREQRTAVSALLADPDTVVIVCGSSGQMPKAVRQALVDVLAASQSSQDRAGSSLSEEGAEQFLAKMEKEGRYKQETWS